MGHTRRRAALAVGALALAMVAWGFPAEEGDAVDATQFTIAFFATLLTGEAVIFALSFSAASSWPSLRAIDSHIAFREWVLAGWVAAMFIAGGLLWQSERSTTYGALLFLLSNCFGIFSFVRLFGLASVGGRNRLLRRTLALGLTELRTRQGSLHEELSDDPVVSAYLGALDQAISSNDPNGMRHLVLQLTGVDVPAPANEDAAALHLEVLHRLCRGALVRGTDPVVVVGCAGSIVESLVRQARLLPDPAVALGEASRYLAWLGSTATLMSQRGIASKRAARELVALCVDSRRLVLRQADPDPVSVSSSADMGSVFENPAAMVLWARDFTEYHGSDQAGAFYGVHQFLTGQKFLGNYWDGASVLSETRTSLYGGSDTPPADTQEARASRGLFGSVTEFDRFWALVSVNAFATLRDVRIAHPPELVRPEFTSDPQLLGAYLRTFASHRWFSDAGGAQRTLGLLMVRADGPDSPWSLARARTDRSVIRTPAPRSEPQDRPAAMVLAVAARLAPLTPGEPDQELRAFLAGLSTPALEAAARLAARVLPGADGVDDPRAAVVSGLRVLQLVGGHTRTTA
ncbi:hypothetical protein [Streptomyces silvensis]|uniref:Uncharacterized protein n=1 Tax=Streptomyces silvensis TaxID=1765722 RepID=A0A0W7X2R2_9ACTN|nr:hypothetical protein [Streptomyces silvensis]KUF17177.1 hypothetical protein AT728_15095 [Streptomyces silvensis]